MKMNFIIILIISLNFNAHAQIHKKCDSKSHGILQLKNNFKVFYKNHKCFFKIFNKSKEFFSVCKNGQEVKKFLSLCSVIKGNAEVTEAYHEAIENLLISQSNCFLNAAENLNKLDQNSLLDIIQSPLFHDNAEVDKAFIELKSVSTKSNFIEAYFQRRKKHSD